MNKEPERINWIGIMMALIGVIVIVIILAVMVMLFTTRGF